MNTIVYTATHSFTGWFSDFRTKFNRSVNRTQYARAGRELRRLGYYKEAENCLREMRKL